MNVSYTTSYSLGFKYTVTGLLTGVSHSEKCFTC